jgi:hypothetical protein
MEVSVVGMFPLFQVFRESPKLLSMMSAVGFSSRLGWIGKFHSVMVNCRC